MYRNLYKQHSQGVVMLAKQLENREYPQKCVIKDIDLFDFQIHVLKC
jgi:hypothetical protein